MNIADARYADLPAERRKYLEELAEAEFSQYELVRQTTWAEPDWCFQAYDGGTFVAYHNIILRTVKLDGAEMRVAGLNNVITLPPQRGRGVASRMLRETQSRWFGMFDVECGMLLCADPLVAFYERLGWSCLKARVVYEQPEGNLTWPAICMLLDPRRRFSAPREVDLGGLPW